MWNFQTNTHLSFRSLRVLLDFSGILCAADELLSGSIQGDNPRGVGVDTSLHNLERTKSGVEEEKLGGGGRNGREQEEEGREMEDEKHRQKQVEVL